MKTLLSLLLCSALPALAGPGFFMNQQGLQISSSPISSFSPTNYGTVIWWIDAALESYANGDAVGTMTDWSASGINATMAVSAGKPTFSTTAGPSSGKCITFDGVDDIMALASNPITASGATMMIVWRNYVDPPTGSGNGAPLAYWGTGGAFNHWPFDDGVVYSGFGSTARKTVGNPAASLANWNVVTIVSVSGSFRFRVNGADVYTTASNSVGSGATPKLGQDSYVFKGWQSAVYIWTGDIGSSNITAAETAIATYKGITF
jgi:hypothetical protein